MSNPRFRLQLTSPNGLLRVLATAAGIVLCGTAAQADPAADVDFASERSGDLLRLHVDSPWGKLGESGINAVGSQVVIKLQDVDAREVGARLGLGLKAAGTAIRGYKVQQQGAQTQLLIELREPYELIDETLAAGDGQSSRWELVLSRQAVKNELSSVDVDTGDGRVAVLLRGGRDLDVQVQYQDRPDRLLLDFPSLGVAHVDSMFRKLTLDPAVFTGYQAAALPKGGSRVTLSVKAGRNISAALPKVTRGEGGTSVLVSLMSASAIAVNSATSLIEQPKAALPPPAEPAPRKSLDLNYRPQPLGPTRPVTPVELVPAAGPAVPAAEAAVGDPADAPVGLAQALQRALEHDPKYLQAKADYETAVEANPQARAALLPVAAYDFQWSRENQEVLDSTIAAYQTLQGQTQHYPVTTHTLTISQPIIRIPAWVKLRQADLSSQQGRLSLVAAEQDLIVRMAGVYLNLMAAQDGVELAGAEREATEAQAEQARERLDSGLGTATQFHEAEARFALTQAREVEAANKLADAHAAIKEILGSDVSALKPFAGDLEPVSPQPAEVQPWVDAAMAQNLALQARAIGTHIADLEIRRQQAGYLPTVDAVGNLSRQNSEGSLFRDNSGNIGKSNIQNLEFGVRVHMPLFEGGATNSLVREARARLDKAQAQQDEESRKTERLARSSLLTVQSSARLLTALRSALFAQQAALQSKQEGLRSGLYSIVQVVDAQRLYYGAKREYLQARYDYLLNRLKLKQAVGALSRQDLNDLAALLQ